MERELGSSGGLLMDALRRLHCGKLLAKPPRAFLPLTIWWQPLHTPEGLARLQAAL